MHKLSILVLLFSVGVQCAPRNLREAHPPSSIVSSKFSTNIHYRHLLFGHRRFRPSEHHSKRQELIPTNKTHTTNRPTRRQNLNTAPTPAPTGPSSTLTTVHINDASDFALILPKVAYGVSLYFHFG